IRPSPSEATFSLSSSSTCISSLIANGRWVEKWGANARDILTAHLQPQWTGGGLPADNIYTTGFVLEAVELLLQQLPKANFTKRDREKLKAAEKRLLDSLKDDGFARLEGYPASAYMTQLAVRVLLKRWSRSKEFANEWAEVEPQVRRRAWE